MDKSKKQKYEIDIKRSLKTMVNLQPELLSFLTRSNNYSPETLLSKTFPYINGLQIIRILTLMEVNFIVSSFLDIVKKTEILLPEEIKIGIIGGGIMGRLILNHLLVFTRDGIKPSNITVSTRQPHHLQFYADHFDILTVFDNQKVAKESDLLFVATTATLDNWILSDIKKAIEAKMTENRGQTNRTSYATTLSIKPSEPGTQRNNGAMTVSPEKIVEDFKKATQNSFKPQQSKKTVQTASLKNEYPEFRPLVYILTSDLDAKKRQRLFPFPVLTPSVRATDISKIIQILNSSITQTNQESLTSEGLLGILQKIMGEWLVELKGQTGTQSDSKEENTENEKQGNSSSIRAKSGREKAVKIEGLKREKVEEISFIQQIISYFEFCCDKVEESWRHDLVLSQGSKMPESKLTNEIFETQGSYFDTFLTKCRKWRMSYNNFIA